MAGNVKSPAVRPLVTTQPTPVETPKSTGSTSPLDHGTADVSEFIGTPGQDSFGFGGGSSVGTNKRSERSGFSVNRAFDENQGVFFNYTSGAHGQSKASGPSAISENRTTVGWSMNKGSHQDSISFTFIDGVTMTSDTTLFSDGNVRVVPMVTSPYSDVMMTNAFKAGKTHILVSTNFRNRHKFQLGRDGSEFHLSKHGSVLGGGASTEIGEPREGFRGYVGAEILYDEITRDGDLDIKAGGEFGVANDSLKVHTSVSYDPLTGDFAIATGFSVNILTN